MVPLQNIGSFLNSSFTVQMSSVDRTSTPQYTANGSAWPAKRRRIEVACNVCKSRKSKCDGARPVCSPCLRRKRGRDAGICKYRTDASDDFVNPQSEPSPLQIKTGKTHSSSIRPEQDKNPSLEVSVPYDHVPVGAEVRSGVASPVVSDGSQSDRDVDAMGCIDGWALRSELLGTASAASFTRQIRKAVDGTDTPPQGTRGSKSTNVSTKLLKLYRKREVAKDPYDPHLVLPPRKTADHLFRIYWAYSDVIFPFLDQEETTRLYDSLWTTSDDPHMDQKVFHCTLNLMFALASKLDPGSKPETRNKSAAVYYDRAKDLLFFNLLDISHFQILQALLLASQYLQSTNMPRQCFQMIGLALWIAHDLGLHIPENIGLLKDPHERELARLVWCGCILMDRIAAMSFGRPVRISREVAERPVYPSPGGPSHRKHGNDGHHKGNPQKLDFFISYCKLHSILGDVLELFYINEDVMSALQSKVMELTLPKRLEQLFEIDCKLKNWQDGLVDPMKVPSVYLDRSETLYITRQANILHARYLYTRLLLFRPFLTLPRQPRHPTTTAGAVQDFRSATSSAVIDQCQVFCVRAAQDIIELIHNNLPSESGDPYRDKLPSVWYSIAYVFTASLVITFASTVPSISDHSPVLPLNETLERGVQVLRHYQPDTKSASRSLSVLKSVHRLMTARQPANQQTSIQPFVQDSNEPTNDFDIDSTLLDFEWMDTDFSTFLPGAQDLAWLETAIGDWNDASWTMNSLGADTTDPRQPI